MKSMRTLIITVAILSISACTQAQWRKTVHGDGNVIRKERKTDTFTGVDVSTGIDVYLKQGNDESVTVEADENLHEYINTEVRGSVLHVYTEANIREAEKKRVYVTLRDIKTLRTSSAGDIKGETPVKCDKLDLSASSAGDIKIDVTAKEINIDISSSGDITITGDTDFLEADLSSAGDLNAYELTAREANISVSSAGDADVSVTEKITARASSAGDINYRGNPKYVDAHSSSAGGVHKR
jgi:hypothetical protein